MADLVSKLLVAFVEMYAEAHALEPRANLAPVVDLVLGDRRNDCLHRCEPCRKRAAVMLDEDAEEAFERTGKRAMNHYGAMIGAVASAIGEFEAFRQDEINLHGTQLPLAADRIANVDIELRAVESAAAFVDLIR